MLVCEFRKKGRRVVRGGYIRRLLGHEQQVERSKSLALVAIEAAWDAHMITSSPQFYAVVFTLEPGTNCVRPTQVEFAARYYPIFVKKK